MTEEERNNETWYLLSHLCSIMLVYIGLYYPKTNHDIIVIRYVLIGLNMELGTTQPSVKECEVLFWWFLCYSTERQVFLMCALDYHDKVHEKFSDSTSSGVWRPLQNNFNNRCTQVSWYHNMFYWNMVEILIWDYVWRLLV